MMKKTFFPLIILFIFSCKKKETVFQTNENSKNWSINWVQAKQQDFVDEEGRFIQLRGINQRIDGLFDASFNDGRKANEFVPTFTKNDVDDIAKLGFNVIRVPLNWSAYEPERDSINPAYFARVREVIQWCKEANIYVQLDWHADAFSKEIGEDGAPYWTHNYLLPNPRWQGPLNFITLAIRRANPWVFESYRNLFRNRDNIRVEFMQMWTDLIREFKDEPTVIGFEPLNEPTTYFGGISDAEFIGFYKECSQKMRAIDTKHLLWLEPDGARNVFDQSPLLTQVFDDKVVYCPHYYPNLLQGAAYTNVPDWIRNTNKSFDRIVTEGKSWKAPVCINEWGINPTTQSGKALITAYQQQMEDRHLHSIFWLWREPKPGTSGADGTWGFFEDLGNGQSWSLREDAVKNAVIPYCMALPGQYSSHRYNDSTKVLECVFNNTNGTSKPIIFIPTHTYNNGFDIFINGNKTSFTADTYNRYLVNWQAVKGQIILEVKPR